MGGEWPELAYTYRDDRCAVVHGDCLAVLADIPAVSVDAIVTDPPYGLGFMGKHWDALPPGKEWAAQCLRVLKPGGHLLAFGGTRTAHRLAVAIEDAGFEIRDSIAWLYGSGFPKSRNIGNGWGTALKPAHEPIVVARKPLVGTVAGNVQGWGTGALNIDACRIAHANASDLATSQAKNPGRADHVTSGVYGAGRPQQSVNASGRWPANVVLDEAAAAELDQQSGTVRSPKPYRDDRADPNSMFGAGRVGHANEYGDSGGASRFFYVAKASRAERPTVDGTAHPTVKPLTLMRWLVRLVTPPDGLVLDPFGGSGTTAEAAMLEGFRVLTIEREADYLPLILARVERANAAQAQAAQVIRRTGSTGSHAATLFDAEDVAE